VVDQSGQSAHPGKPLAAGGIRRRGGAAITSEFHCFRCERLQLVEPPASDFLQAEAWLQHSSGPPLRSADALHLAIAQREQLTLTTADPALIQAAHRLGVAHHWISTQPS
jgi:predicted nucleic acid-binding protein